MQVLTYAAEMGHTGLALKAWECMEIAILPSGPPAPGTCALSLQTPAPTAVGMHTAAPCLMRHRQML